MCGCAWACACVGGMKDTLCVGQSRGQKGAEILLELELDIVTSSY